MPLDEHDAGLAGLEAALAALAPMPGRLDRDGLLFRAGQASVRGRGWAWPPLAAACGLVAIVLGVILAARPSPAPIERVVYVNVFKESRPPIPADHASAPPAREPEPFSPSPSVAAQSPMNYLQLERQVLRWGLDGVPETAEVLPPSAPPMTRDNALGSPAEPMSFTKFFDLRSVFH